MGEALRLVSIGSTPRPSDRPEYEEPAKEFEVVRRLGAGSYAVVYLVREVLYRPPPSDDGHMSTVGLMDMDDKFRPSTVYGREYAIKCLSKANLDEEALAAQMSEVCLCPAPAYVVSNLCKGHYPPISAFAPQHRYPPSYP